LSEGEEGKILQLFCVVWCTRVVHNDTHTYVQFLGLGEVFARLFLV